MATLLTPLAPAEAHDRLARGQAVLVDIREGDEFARRHVRGAISRPLSALDGPSPGIDLDKSVIFTCRTGMRTGANRERLAGIVHRESFVLQGGVDAWEAAGLPLVKDRRAPLEIMRQVQIAAGALVPAGVLLGFGVHPAFFGLSGLVGVGLGAAGVTGFCGMARLLAVMPWNRSAAA